MLSAVERKLALKAIPALDGFRALSVALVVGYHFGFEFIPGPLGVTAFFVLSGFLITSLLLKEAGATGTVSFQGFYWRRALRIFPAFYAYWATGVGIEILRGRAMEWGITVSSLLYVSNYYVGLVRVGDHFLSHTWSLAIEEQFYLIWPVCFWLLRKNLKRLTWVLGGIVLAVWIHRALLATVFHASSSYLYHAFDTRADALMVGCLTSVLVKRGALSGFFRTACSRSWQPWIPICLLGLTVAIRPAGFANQFRFGVSYALEPLLLAALMLQLVGLNETRTWKWIDHPVTRYLGRISYPIYLWQQLTLFTARRLTADYPVLVQFLFAVAVTVAFASASYFLVEKPFLRLKSRIGNRAPVPRTAPAAGGIPADAVRFAERG